MTEPTDATDNLIKTILAANGRVLPVDLGSMDEAEREAALRAYFETHREAQPLHFEGSSLVAGPEPSESLSDIDQLLGGYTGVSAEAKPSDSDETSAGPSAAGRPTRDVTVAATRGPKNVRQATPLPKPRRETPSAAKKEMPKTSKLYLIWWAPSVLVPVLGGVVAWIFLRRKHERAARAMLGLGLATAMIGSLLFARYAAQIAGFVSGDSRGRVIKLPPTKAVEPGAPSGSSTDSGASGGSSGRQ